MVEHFFQFVGPRDILNKAHRDLARLHSDPNIDTVFDFFVTAYHVMDYVKALGTVPATSLDSLYAEEDFQMCQYICNKGKHLALRRGDSYETHRRPGAALGDFTLGETPLGADPAYLVIGDSGQVNVVDLADRIFDRWEAFFRDNAIS